jgi:hypothetical protein
MSLNVFIAICVLACDFMIYAFFQWTFGEKHRKYRRPLPKMSHRPKSVPMEKRKHAIEAAPASPYASKPHLLATPQRHRQSDREVA